MPETFRGITFDEEGICNFCLGYESNTSSLGKEKLIHELSSTDHTGEYDCVVPFSGGKDSAYILYYVVKELDLNPIVVSYNSGYQSKIAEENVRNACDILGVELLVVRSLGEIQRKLLHSNYLLSESTGGRWGVCGNCTAILRTVSINTAKKFNVPFIIWGSSTIESSDVKKHEKSKLGEVQRVGLKRWINYIAKLVNDGLKKPLSIYYAIQYGLLSITQRISLHFPLRHALNPISLPPYTMEDPKFIHFYDYIHWASIKNVDLLKKELGWKHPEGKDSRFDCELHCVGNIHHLRDFGISHDGLTFCKFIREGSMSREEAVIREAEVVNSVQDECKTLLENINLKDREII